MILLLGLFIAYTLGVGFMFGALRWHLSDEEMGECGRGMMVACMLWPLMVWYVLVGYPDSDDEGTT